jgi:hypothetical protein
MLTALMNSYTRNAKSKLIFLRMVVIVLSLCLGFSIFYSQMTGVYLSVIMLFVVTIPTIDRISITNTDVIFERFYFYSIVRLSWSLGDAPNFRFNLYSRRESGDLPESANPLVDFIVFVIPFQYKSQGIVVSKGATKWSWRSADFGLYDIEYAMISKLLKT